jgi:LmbE family N-acetylglucosaminyl deacetylase
VATSPLNDDEQTGGAWPSPSDSIELLRPTLVVSPHLDDAVLSAGNLLAVATGVTVLTVFAGSPPASSALTPWDRECGFNLGDDVIAARREEDERALTMLGASTIWLNYLEEQYGTVGRPSVDELSEVIVDAVARAEVRCVLQPLGLIHPDHELVAAASWKAHYALPEISWFAYGDLPYSYMVGGRRKIRQALALLTAEGVRADLVTGSVASPTKRAAIACYPTQERGLQKGYRRGIRHSLRRERYWRLTDATSSS